MNNKNDFFPKNLSKDQCKDTGMAMILILLFISLYNQNKYLYFFIFLVLIINMTIPNVFKPIAFLWFSLSKILGFVMSKILLTIVYIILVVPVGLFFRLFRIDLINLKKFKKNTITVFKVRDHLFNSKDIEYPY